MGSIFFGAGHRFDGDLVLLPVHQHHPQPQQSADADVDAEALPGAGALAQGAEEGDGHGDDERQHPGEAAAIIRSTVEKVQADRIGAARELAVQTGAISILKGAGSVITLRSSRTWINPTGNAMLATAGSGDVLSGMLGAFFAQGYDLVSATLAAVYLHGKASEEYAAGFTASDIAPAAAAILNTMRLSRPDPEA